MKDTLASIAYIAIAAVGFYGYVNNIVRIWDCHSSSCRTTRIIGAITTVPGAIMGFIDFK